MDCISGCFAEIRHHSSSVGRNVLHLRFKVKYCHEIFNDTEVEKRCEETFQEVSEQKRWLLRETGFDKDHVHITIDAGTNGPADVAKALKGTSGKKLLKEFSYLKKKYFWRSGLWSPAIYFDSLGERTVMDMDEYVRDQGVQRMQIIPPGQTRLIDFAI